MSEYIIEWFGIGEQLTRLREGNVPFVLWPKLIREERRREEIVRCRDCVHFDAYGNTFGWCALHDIDCSERRYCAWGERREP